jgi:hypothetical protein
MNKHRLLTPCVILYQFYMFWHVAIVRCVCGYDNRLTMETIYIISRVVLTIYVYLYVI